MLSKVLSLDKLSFPPIWNKEQEKEGEKEKVGGRPAKFNEKTGDRQLEREIKNRRRHFFCSGDKIRNASGHHCKVKMRGSEKK